MQSYFFFTLLMSNLLLVTIFYVDSFKRPICNKLTHIGSYLPFEE
jgi:hypothetical protein